MAIETNKSDVVVSKSKTLWTGLCSAKVIAVNPSAEELSKIYGTEIKKEPSYIIEKPECTCTRLSFILSMTGIPEVEQPVITPLNLFVEDRDYLTKDGGKYQFLNKIGQQIYSPSAEKISEGWFVNENVRIAKVGESLLLKFISAWANVKAKDELYLETIDKIVKGDIKEIKDLLKKISGNEFIVLLGVKLTEKNLYQGIYIHCFGRSYNRNEANFIKCLGDQFTLFKDHDYQNSLELKKYTPKTTTITEVSNTEVTENSAWNDV